MFIKVRYRFLMDQVLSVECIELGRTKLQQVILGKSFGYRGAVVTDMKNGFWIGTDEYNRISFTIDFNEEDFASIRVTRKVESKDLKVTDCIPLDKENLNWYGGPEQKTQKYPVQKFNFTDFPYVPRKAGLSSVMERYWLASNGFFILIDYDTPLFLSQNSNDQICFTAKRSLPYNTHSWAGDFSFSYRIGAGITARKTHLNVIRRILGRPISTPSERIVRYPTWNSWVRYGKELNQSSIALYAAEIKDHGFKSSLMMIDDSWEECYGAMTLDKIRFPNLREFADHLMSEDIAIGLWVHPFINKNCDAHYGFARDNSLLVRSYPGAINTSWWNGEDGQAAHVDFTHEGSVSWFKYRLQLLQSLHGIDTFKFDYGETNWLPHDPELTGDKGLSPGLMSRSYAQAAASFGDMVEVRTGWGTQRLPIFVRMHDFYSRWGRNNGLRSLIPKLIQFNMNGYVFVKPDMIGGNQYNNDRITKELFIRWLQASTFMPCLQFSFAPWQLDQETVKISKKFTQLHEKFAELILKRFKLAVANGDPVNPPIWWLDPEDKTAQAIDDGKTQTQWFFTRSNKRYF